MIAIGPSTGWLHVKDISRDLSDISDHALRAGATAIEIVIPNIDERPLSGAVSKDFDFVSVHLPAVANDVSNEEIMRLHSIVSHTGAMSAVVHPSCIPDEIISLLHDRGVPVACENMDRTKPSGCSPEEVVQVMKKHGIPGIFDFQHAYEYAVNEGRSYREVVEEFVNVMLDNGGVTHVHVSGENQRTNHALLQHATNREEILDAVRMVLGRTQVPIILEGEFHPNKVQDEFEQEIQTIQSVV